MKIAVCFSGQLRGSWRKCLESWKQVFGQHEVYYFGHTWTTRSAPNYIKVTTGDHDIETIDPNEFQELRRELPGLELEVENQIEFPQGLDQALHDPNYQSQFYSVMRSAHIKRTHEINNNTNFDLCIRMRWDTMFEQEWTLTSCDPGTIQVIHLGFNLQQLRVGDIYWSAPSEEFDIVCDFYRHFGRHKADMFLVDDDFMYGPEHIFAYYLKENNFKLQQIYPPVKLVRPKPEHIVGAGDYETT